jgi:hypothetical protein
MPVVLYDPRVVSPRYPSAAANLWRWVEASEVDSAVHASLADADEPTLLVYAGRCALAAVRTRDPAWVNRAIAALPLVRGEPDRLIEVATLVAHAARSLGVTAPAGRADGLVGELMADGVDLVDDIGYRELDTPAGRVFLEDESGPFAPAADLVGVAYRVADMLEADRYEVASVGIGQTLHPIWVLDAINPEASAATAKVTGCVHVGAVAGDCELSVFVAEAASEQDAEAIGAAADRVDHPRHPQIGVFTRRLCAILYAGTFDSGPVGEDKSTLDRFRSALRDILRAAGS